MGGDYMRETEYKFLVTKEKFYEIMTQIKGQYPNACCDKRIQINYYYDTFDGYLLSNHTTLRVRQTEDSIALELKESLPAVKDFSTSKETTKKISGLLPEITLKDGRFAWIPFQLQGNLVTKRVSIKPCQSLSIDFDINYYWGYCDYEIEMEFNKDALKATTVLINNLGLMPLRNKTGGKAIRFFKLKSNLFKD